MTGLVTVIVLTGGFSGKILNKLSLSLIRYLVHSGVKDWAVTNNAVVWQWRWWIGGRHLIINNTSDQSPPAFFARLYQLFDRKLSLQTWSNWISIPTPWALSDPAAPSYSSGEFKQRRSQEMGVLGRQSRISITVLVVVLLVPGDWGRITIRGEIWYWLSKLVQSVSGGGVRMWGPEDTSHTSRESVATVCTISVFHWPRRPGSVPLPVHFLTRRKFESVVRDLRRGLSLSISLL